MQLEEIKNIAVFGAGTMGPGIAQTFAQHGYQVWLYSRRQETLARARSVIHASLDLLVNRGIITPEQKEVTWQCLRVTDSMVEAGRTADLVVETIVEDREAKKELFEQLDNICPAGTIFTSNTSSLDVFSISPRAPLTVVAHWFAPPHIIPLVEVVREKSTADATVQTVVDLLKRVGKVPVVMQRFVPGFAINRLLRALGREIFYLLDSGVISAADLDLAVKASIAPRMMVLGVVQRYDFTGLDLSARNLENPDFSEAPENKRPASLFKLVEAGHLGVKTGKGFYDYGDRPLVDILRERDERLLRVLQATRFCIEDAGKQLALSDEGASSSPRAD